MFDPENPKLFIFHDETDDSKNVYTVLEINYKNHDPYIMDIVIKFADPSESVLEKMNNYKRCVEYIKKCLNDIKENGLTINSLGLGKISPECINYIEKIEGYVSVDFSIYLEDCSIGVYVIETH